MGNVTRRSRATPNSQLVGNQQIPTLLEWNKPLTEQEEKFCAKLYHYGNATKAFIEVYNHTGPRRHAWSLSWEVANRPHVRRRMREYESAAAAAAVIDYAAILDHDRQVVEGFKYADQITARYYQCCRYCHGNKHKYQWIDYEEYLAALSKVQQENEVRKAGKQRELPFPSDEGGYGYVPANEPNLFCPQCEGRGIAVDYIADTTKLEGPARVIVKGIKVTSSGTEVVLHDIDKAKERLLRAGGILKDSAADVARGAAAGAAAGATAAIAAAEAAKSMTPEEAQKLYLELA